MRDAQIGDEAEILPCDPGDEYGWVTDREWFEDRDEPVTVEVGRWQLMSKRTETYFPPTTLCPRCHGEGLERYPESSGYSDHDCSLCKGDGGHPLAGQWVVEEC